MNDKTMNGVGLGKITQTAKEREEESGNLTKALRSRLIGTAQEANMDNHIDSDRPILVLDQETGLMFKVWCQDKDGAFVVELAG